MARRAPGPIGEFGGLKIFGGLRRRRRALEAIGRAFPELGERERQTLARRSSTRHRQSLKEERRAGRQSPVDFCRGLTFEGWENLHNLHNNPPSAEPIFLLAPLGSLEVATRVLELYHPGREHGVLAPAEDGQTAMLFRQPLVCSSRLAEMALATGAPAIWVLAIPESRGRWTVCFQPPIPPFADDTAASLTQRYLGLLEEAIRCHPESWPWGGWPWGE